VAQTTRELRGREDMDAMNLDGGAALVNRQSISLDRSKYSTTTKLADVAEVFQSSAGGVHTTRW
jgi:hypothetical protein